ncbi:hypothetical protein EXN66_Car004974 [Channa argus]|uniref:Uncharacterized protein n=1 Tax=Channa argus TaxID=215402 RepID=A0A6G1PGE0_CHAAH|nr:hypothetical protein EXN66_Car004974 [Channa argus]
MRKRFSVSQVLDSIFSKNEEENTEEQSDMEEQVFEEEDNVEFYPEETDTSDESDEVTSGEFAERFKSKDGKIFWRSVPHDAQGGAAAANLIIMTPGITRLAVTRVSDIKTYFELFMPLSLKRVILDMTNLEGKMSMVTRGKTLMRNT